MLIFPLLILRIGLVITCV